MDISIPCLCVMGPTAGNAVVDIFFKDAFKCLYNYHTFSTNIETKNTGHDHKIVIDTAGDEYRSVNIY